MPDKAIQKEIEILSKKELDRSGSWYKPKKMYDWMTAFDFIVTFARLHGMTRKEAEKAVETLIKWAGDDPEREGLRLSLIHI